MHGVEHPVPGPVNGQGGQHARPLGSPQAPAAQRMDGSPSAGWMGRHLQWLDAAWIAGTVVGSGVACCGLSAGSPTLTAHGGRIMMLSGGASNVLACHRLKQACCHGPREPDVPITCWSVCTPDRLAAISRLATGASIIGFGATALAVARELPVAPEICSGVGFLGAAVASFATCLGHERAG